MGGGHQTDTHTDTHTDIATTRPVDENLIL